MWSNNEIKFFRKSLLGWFDLNKRDFPWREKDISNFRLIISEILLQKTKAETVAKYYNTFFNKYPDWESLFESNINEIEQILLPLGLYHHRAKRIIKIVEEIKRKKGLLPKDKSELQESSLSTIYLSNAYELFILNKRAALLDVNMYRLLTRFFSPKEKMDIRRDKDVQELAYSTINIKQCKELNWAILDFAAMICKSKNPKCEDCPLRTRCKFFTITNSEQPENIIQDFQASINYNSIPHNNPDKPFKLVSLFSGCGGMDLGFEGGFIVHKDSINLNKNKDFVKKVISDNQIQLNYTKFQTVFANDILTEARNVWVHYFGKTGLNPDIYHVDSIVDLVKLHKKGFEIFPQNVDIVTGGFPCQDFSLAGKRKGLNSHKDHNGKVIKSDTPSIETRGQLYMWLKEVVEIVKPKIFIAENVKGLVNLSNIKDIIQSDFSTASDNDYVVLNPKVLHAADFGVPQSRERVIFIGIKKSALNIKALFELTKESINPDYDPYPIKTHGFTSKNSDLNPPVTLKHIFENLLEPCLSSDPSQMFYSRAKYMGSHCQGQNEINLNGIGPTIRAEHHGNIEFRRLSREHNGKIYQELENDRLIERRLTPRECALIQTFPPDFDFVVPGTNSRFLVSPSSAYKLIGNAVPPLLAYHVAKRIEKMWDLYFKPDQDGNFTKSRASNQRVQVAT